MIGTHIDPEERMNQLISNGYKVGAIRQSAIGVEIDMVKTIEDWNIELILTIALYRDGKWREYAN